MVLASNPVLEGMTEVWDWRGGEASQMDPDALYSADGKRGWVVPASLKRASGPRPLKVTSLCKLSFYPLQGNLPWTLNLI